MVKISREHIKDGLTPLPPIDEQKAIARTLTHTTERTVGLLKERHSALIAAPVTGQIGVEAPHDPRG
jgi:hypothetical protein